MSHYKDGSPAQVGDLIICDPPYAGAISSLGILVAITPAAETCNGQLYPFAWKWPGIGWLPAGRRYQECITLKDCLPVPARELARSA